MVELVFVDRTRKVVTVDEAWAVCSDPLVAGKVIDALTGDTALQAQLRYRMDNLFD